MHVDMPSSRASLWTRFRQLDRQRRHLLAEACVRLAYASLALAILPFRRAIRLGAVPLAEPRGEAGDCVWAIEAAARRMPWRTVCIHKGLALQRMLRDRGIDARLHYGIGTDADEGKLQAHVWVTLNGEALIGGSEARRFAPVAVFP